jgi:Flp pilus assembly pilin Flp
MSRLIVRFALDDQGQDLIEYVMLASFIACVVLGGVTLLGDNLNTWYSSIGAWASDQYGKF